MKKLILTSLISSMVIIWGFSLAIAETNVEFKFQSSPTDEQIFKAAAMLLRHYRFDIKHEDAQAALTRAVRKITKENAYYLEYSVEIKEKQIRVIARITEDDPTLGISTEPHSATVFGKAVSASKDTRFPKKWRLERELQDARWLIGKVVRTIGTRLDALEFKSQMAK